jgi:hypothetical protein
VWQIIDDENMKNNPKDIIEKWINEVPLSEMPSADDLHVDDISSDYRHPSTWVLAARESLNLTLETLKAKNLPYGVALSLSLRDTQQPIGFTLKTISDLQDEMDYQPPSLFLLLPETVIPSHELIEISPKDIIGLDIEDALVTYSETFEEDDEYIRFLGVWCPGQLKLLKKDMRLVL